MLADAADRQRLASSFTLLQRGRHEDVEVLERSADAPPGSSASAASQDTSLIALTLPQPLLHHSSLPVGVGQKPISNRTLAATSVISVC